MSRLSGPKFHSDSLTSRSVNLDLQNVVVHILPEMCLFFTPKFHIALWMGPQFVSRPEDWKSCVSSVVDGLVLVLRFCFVSFLSTYPIIPLCVWISFQAEKSVYPILFLYLISDLFSQCMRPFSSYCLFLTQSTI